MSSVSVMLNSGRLVHDEVMAREQVRMRSDLIAELSALLEAEPLVEAVWLVGSLGRGRGDPLSDVDLVITPIRAPAALAGRLRELVAAPGPVALIYPTLESAPNPGFHMSVLYELSPLPLYVDWSVWPFQPRRPSDATPLIERDASRFETTGSAADIGAALTTSKPSSGKVDIDRYRLFMSPIVAKDAARGWAGSVTTMMEYMKLPSTGIDTLGSAIAVLRQTIDDFGTPQPAVAMRAVRRYLDQLELLMGLEAAQ